MLQQLPQAVIFDWDNTLVDTLGVVQVAVNATLLHFGYPHTMSLEEVHAQSRYSAKDLFPKIFGDKSEEAKVFYYLKYEELSKGKITPLPGALGLLKLFADQKIYMAIVSNKRGGKLRDEVEALGWTHYFFQIIGSTDCDYDKPSPVCVDRALINMTSLVDRSRVWFIGDSIADYLCAKNAGCVPILVAQVEDVSDGCAKFDGCKALENYCMGLVE
jgi:phosphoglycolate phosphatase